MDIEKANNLYNFHIGQKDYGKEYFNYYKMLYKSLTKEEYVELFLQDVYVPDSNYRKVLLHKTYKGIPFYILSLGSHPTCYIDLKNTTLDGIDYGNDILEDIEVHFGFTYSADHLWISNEESIDGWFLGWDYAHCNDFFLRPDSRNIYGKRYNIVDLFMEVVKVIDQIKRIEEMRKDEQ